MYEEVSQLLGKYQCCAAAFGCHLYGAYADDAGEEYKIDMQFSTEILKPVIEGEETEAEKQAKEEEQKTVGQWWITVLVGFAIISITVAVIVVGKFSRMMRMR